MSRFNRQQRDMISQNHMAKGDGHRKEKKKPKKVKK